MATCAKRHRGSRLAARPELSITTQRRTDESAKVLDPHWEHLDPACQPETLFGFTVPFDLYRVTNVGGAATTLEARSQHASTPSAKRCTFPDSNIYAFTSFDPQALAAGCIAGDEGSGGDLCAFLSVPLAAGEAVDLLLTTFDNDNGLGPYTLELIAPGTTISVEGP